MNEEEFNVQMARLRTQWRNSYGPDRTGRIWKVFKNLSQEFFAEMIDEAFDTCRQAPLVEDLSLLEVEIGKRRTQQKVYQGYATRPDVEGPLSEAARNNHTADPEFVKACQKLLKDKFAGRINMAQFLEGCDALDQIADQLNPSGRVSHFRTGGRDYKPYKED